MDNDKEKEKDPGAGDPGEFPKEPIGMPPVEDIDIEADVLGEAPPEPFVPELPGSRKKLVTAARISSTSPNFVGRTQQHIQSSRKIRIIIPSTETQKDDVFVAVNGQNVLIKRDVAVDVPEPLLKALNNATMTVYTQTKRPDGEGYEMIPREVMRFPYRVVIED